MILDNITKAAFKLINTVAPFLNPEGFLKAMYKDFDSILKSNPNVSDEEIAQRMMGGIQEDKYGFGKDMADAASYVPETVPVTNTSFEGELKNNPAVQGVLIDEPIVDTLPPGGVVVEIKQGFQQQ